MTSSFAAAVTTYDAAAQPQRLAARQLVVEAHRCITGRERARADVLPTCVLDLGCGTGLATRAWLDQLQQSGQPGPDQVLLVDQAAAMVERARAVAGGASWGCRVVLDAFQPEAVGVLAPSCRRMAAGFALQAMHWVESYALNGAATGLGAIAACR